MKSCLILVNLLIGFQSVLCRDFYLGMFKTDDFLVAQDNLYMERRTHSFVQAEYGRLFKCPITYFRVVDRLGVGPGPTVRIVRGGLRRKYIAVRIKSTYNRPLSVNIYVGCENKQPRSPKRPIKATTIQEEEREVEEETEKGPITEKEERAEGENEPGTVEVETEKAGEADDLNEGEIKGEVNEAGEQEEKPEE